MRETKELVENLCQGRGVMQGLDNREITQGCWGARDLPQSPDNLLAPAQDKREMKDISE